MNRSGTTGGKVCGAAIALLVLLGLTASLSAASRPSDRAEPGSQSQSQRVANPQLFSRIVSARVFHTQVDVARNTNARRVGRAIGRLRPTWVTGLIRYRRGQSPDRREIRAWRKLTRRVRAASPDAQFDVVLNAKQYRRGQQLRQMMARVRRKLDNDGWFLDFYSKAFRKRPRMIRAASASAHAHGEWIGGNVFGLAKRRTMPLSSDFLSVQDFRLKLNLPAVRRLARQGPVVYHLHNDPDNQRGGGCRFIEQMTTARRQALVRRRSAQGLRYGFRVSYPVLFPECIQGPADPGRTRRRSFLYSYNAFRDPPMPKTIIKLLDRYELPAATRSAGD